MKHSNFLIISLVLLLSYLPSYSTQFDDVLLIVNYNHPHYESVPLLKKVYGSYFKNIVFYGPTQHPDIIDLPHYKGYFSYLCISDAMEKFPHYSGYLFLMDDCIINPTVIHNFDNKKINYAFCIEHGKSFLIPIKQGPPFPWSWWKTQWGKQAIKSSLKQMPKNYKKILKTNSGRKIVVGAFSDFAYVPAHYKDEFIELAQLFGKHTAFLEIALPTILCSLSLQSEWVWLPGRSIYSNPLKLFDKNAIFNHPIKLSSKEHRDFIDQFFSKLSSIKEK